MAKGKKLDYIYAVGRRKTTSCRVRLFKGKGENLVNGVLALDYFPGDIFKAKVERYYKLVDGIFDSKYHFSIKVEGGGKSGQLDACLHGLSRALVKAEPDLKGKLKKEGFLTRDARIRERRKVGTGGKARRKKQSPKR